MEECGDAHVNVKNMSVRNDPNRFSAAFPRYAFFVSVRTVRANVQEQYACTYVKHTGTCTEHRALTLSTNHT